MRGRVEGQVKMLLGVTPDEFIPEGHPIRRIRAIVDAVPEELLRLPAAELGGSIAEWRRTVCSLV